MTEINKLIEETERLLAAGTQGQWSVHTESADPSIGRELGFDVQCDFESILQGGPDCGPMGEDAHLIAHAPTALRALVDEVYRLRQQVAKLEFDATTQPNADWEPNSKSVAEVSPPTGIRTCNVCQYYAIYGPIDEQGEHHPACTHAPPNPRNAGPRYRSPAVYEGNVGDTDSDPV